MENGIFTLDPSDRAGIREIMARYGDSRSPFYGKNQDGEEVTISVFYDKIVMITEQANGWIRKNIYLSDGSCEELFDGKWNETEDEEQALPDPKTIYREGFEAGARAARSKQAEEAFQKKQQKKLQNTPHIQTMG